MSQDDDDDDDVVIHIRSKLEGAESSGINEFCIYKVPLDIRKLNEDAYTPKVVSIGPFHQNSHPRLLNMEEHKLIHCKAFLEQTKTDLDSWIRCIQEKELKIRRCYSDTIRLSTMELVTMIFVDSGFIFELFWSAFYVKRSENGTALLKLWLNTNIRLDLLLLENQLPFFLLQELFDLSFNCNNPQSPYKNPPSLVELTMDYFAFYNRCDLDPSYFDNNRMITNFTDLIRIFHLKHPLDKRPRRGNDGSVIHIPSATELLEAGVRFKVNTKKKRCLLDLKFSRGVLEIPQLEVEDWTEVLFRNMVALEQCHYPGESYIREYAAVLDFLVNTSGDVDILVRKRVLINWLWDTDSVANMFNGLRKNVIPFNFNADYYRLCRKLNVYCSNPRRKWMPTLMRDYCNGPWQIAATTAAVFLLILSLVQTVCSVLQVTQQQHAFPK